MNVWYHHPTIFNQRRVLQIAGLLTLCVAFITMLFFSITANAAPGINQTISFQGRLMTPQGQPVADGYYNIQFKIYKDGTGTTAGNPNGTLLWTETHTNKGGTSGVLIKNGYLSVALGAVNPFGNQVDWNEDTLWLSMNIAGSSASCTTFGSAPCTADGEMAPMKRLTATPYAMNAGKVGGKSADDLIHNGTSQQTANFNISGTGIANILQGSSGVISPVLDRADAGMLAIGTTNATAIQIGSSAGSSSLSLQGGSSGVAVKTGGAFSVTDANNQQLLGIAQNGDVAIAGKTTINDSLTSKGETAVQSADGSQTASLGWKGSNNTAYLQSSTNTISLQGNSVDLLTASNAGGKATVGIGNAATSGYALDVTGEVNASSQYMINGVSTLSGNALAFAGASASTITAASGQSLSLNSETSVQIGDGAATGQPTLLALDRSATTPTASGDAALGSMYYDTTLGKVQCYEADGWGSCSSSPDNFVTLSPEYTNAVTNGSGTGTMSSDICSDALNINDGSSGQPTICGTNETYNFYNWTTTETSAQTKDIYVTYQLPSNFTGFVSGSTSLVGRTDASAANVAYRVYKNTPSGLVACGSSVSVSTGAQTTWQKATATGTADPANCGFSAGDSLVVKISLTAEHTTQATNAYASTLSFAFSDD